MTPFLNAMINRIVFGKASTPRVSPPLARLPRPPSFYFSPEDIPGGLESAEDAAENEASATVMA